MTWASPSLGRTAHRLVAGTTGRACSMLLCRLLPRGGWIARWPLAFIVGTYAGIRLISYLDADFVSQIRNTIVPLVVLTQTGAIRPLGVGPQHLRIVGVLSA